MNQTQIRVENGTVSMFGLGEWVHVLGSNSAISSFVFHVNGGKLLKERIYSTRTNCFLLTNSYVETRKRVIGKRANPDQTPHHVASE